VKIEIAERPSFACITMKDSVCSSIGHRGGKRARPGMARRGNKVGVLRDAMV
jgi:hypothetical protein